MSADIGEGHDSAARAVAETLESTWPSCQVEVIELFAAMRGGSGPVLRSLYMVAISLVPWLQQLWFDAVARSGVVRSFYGRVVGGWAARALAPRVASLDPDAVISTYPLATAGLGRLRRAGDLTVPVTAVLSDVAVHEFWVYDGVDCYAVVDNRGRERVHHLAPRAAVAVLGPIVTRAFRTRPAATRDQWGLATDALVVVISAGSLALGRLSGAVTTALAAHERCVVVALCGHNENVRRRLERLARSNPRLRVLGWVADPAGLTAVADVVINNAGGVTAQEALSRGRALVMFQPVAGHGRASALALARAGVAEHCRTRDELTRVLRGYAEDPGKLAAAQRRAARYAGRHRLDELVRALPRRPANDHAQRAAVAGRGTPHRPASST